MNQDFLPSENPQRDLEIREELPEDSPMDSLESLENLIEKELETTAEEEIEEGF